MQISEKKSGLVLTTKVGHSVFIVHKGEWLEVNLAKICNKTSVRLRFTSNGNFTIRRDKIFDVDDFNESNEAL